MARVFLSYDRDDAARARTIALALEKAGHEVWWDQVIRAGTQFGNEIEQALKDSEAVIVLWSKQSIDSPWVRDEATAGRDTGRLVPVLIDPCLPPMGFRQFQNIDLSRWKGRAGSGQLDMLLDAVADAPAGAPPMPAKLVSAPKRSIAPLWILGPAFSGLLLIVGWTLWRQADSPAVPLIAVEAADQSPGPKSWARDLLVKLASLQTANSDMLRLVDQGSHEQPDLIFEVGGLMQSNNPEASLLLRSGRDRAVLWSKDFQQPGTKLADLRQQLAFTAAQVLGCALEGLNADGTSLDQQVLKLYLNGCSAFATSADGPDLTPIFLEVTRKAPAFQGAWAKVLHNESWYAAWAANRDTVRPSLKLHLAQARKVNPQMAEVYIAEAELLPGNPPFESMQLLDQAVQHNPQSSEALFLRSILLMQVGRITDALDDARRATEINPLSAALRDNYIQFLAFSGSITAALEEVAKAERLWPGASNLAATRFWLNANYVDAGEALRALPPERDAYRGVEATRYGLKAQIEPSASNIDRAIAEARVLSKTDGERAVFLETLAKFGRGDELFQRLLQLPLEDARRVRDHIFRPTFVTFWRNPRSMKVAARLGLTDYWRRSGKWPDFCSEAPYDCKAEAAKVVPNTAEN